MEPSLQIFLLCAALGTIVGLLAGLLGIGGGLIIVPALVFMLHIFLDMDIEVSMPIAVATSLSTVIMTGVSSAITHYKMGNIDRSIVTFCGLGIAFGAIAGAQFATYISGVMLQRVFAGLVILIALQMLLGKTKPTKSNSDTQGPSKGRLASIGLGSGYIAALMGIGGGALIVPALLWCTVDVRKAIGCAAFSGIVIAFFGTASFVYSGWNYQYLPNWSIGYVYLPATLGIISTSMLIAPIGAKLGQRINTHNLKRIFAGFLVLVSLRMIIGIE